MEVELSADLEMGDAFEDPLNDIYDADSRLAPLKEEEPEPTADAFAFDTAAYTFATAAPTPPFTAIKQEPEAPPSPTATAPPPFFMATGGEGSAEPSLVKQEPTPPPVPPPASAAATPPPSLPAAMPPHSRRRATTAAPSRSRAGRRATSIKKKTAKGEEAALKDKKCRLAWEAWQASLGKDPRSSHESEGQAGRKEKFNYYDLFNPMLLYACSRYRHTFKLWVLREGFLRNHPWAIDKGLIPCKASCSRAVKKFKKLATGGG